jgi:ParB family transcriptional regulator, chromosome partitioning protein
MPIKELSKPFGRRDVHSIDPRIIKQIDGWNVRDEGPELQQHIEIIARSIKAIGYDQTKPITIVAYDGGFAVIDGHCRLRATMLAIEWGCEIVAIPVITENKATNEADRVLGMITRNSGRNLTPLEKLKVFKRLAAFGWSGNAIAEKTGMSIGGVEAIFLLGEATPETHAAIIRGEVSASAVTAAVREHGAERAEEVVDKAIAIAKKNGKAKATGAMVERAAETTDGEKPAKVLPLSKVLRFFQLTISEGDGTPNVQTLSAALLDWRAGELNDEEFMAALIKICG